MASEKLPGYDDDSPSTPRRGRSDIWTRNDPDLVPKTEPATEAAIVPTYRKPLHGNITESTIARIAGNIFAGVVHQAYASDREESFINWAVAMARDIATEVRATRPAQGEE